MYFYSVIGDACVTTIRKNERQRTNSFALFQIDHGAKAEEKAS
jgi:hypothetical protein